MSDDPPLGLRVAPFLSMLSVGYVLFAYASIPEVVIDRFGVDYVSVGLLMSAALVSFTVVQVPGSRVVDRRSTAHILLAATAAQGLVAVGLDLARSFEVLLALRALWGLCGGLIVTTGATHFARLYSGPTATRYQGVFGAMVTVGGAVAFAGTPTVVERFGWFGVHSLGGAVAVPAVALFWASLRYPRARALVAPVTGEGGDGDTETDPSDVEGGAGVLPHGTVIVASLGYLATLSGYVTLSTFITAYFDDLGVVAPLNVAVLVMATAGRLGGGLLATEWALADRVTIAGTTGAAALGFVALSGVGGPLLLALPLVTMLAVSLPFGAIFNVAAAAAEHEGRALSVVVATGNFGSLVLPAVTGLILEATGEYTGAFLLLGGLNGATAVAAVAVLGSPLAAWRR